MVMRATAVARQPSRPRPCEGAADERAVAGEPREGGAACSRAAHARYCRRAGLRLAEHGLLFDSLCLCLDVRAQSAARTGDSRCRTALCGGIRCRVGRKSGDEAGTLWRGAGARAGREQAPGRGRVALAAACSQPRRRLHGAGAGVLACRGCAVWRHRAALVVREQEHDMQTVGRHSTASARRLVSCAGADVWRMRLRVTFCITHTPPRGHSPA